jgi:fluoroacetyl-CoA thioesterase
VYSEDAALRPGLEGQAEAVVTEDLTAARVGSGDVAVLATPMVLALAERAAVAAVAGAVPEGSTTVGASVELTHQAPTPLGRRVRARARLEEVVGGRRLRFSFTVRDQAGQVASGTHLRMVVRRDEFEATAEARGSSPR